MGFALRISISFWMLMLKLSVISRMGTWLSQRSARWVFLSPPEAIYWIAAKSAALLSRSWALMLLSILVPEPRDASFLALHGRKRPSWWCSS